MRPYIFGQKWLLGFALALIYIPLRTYINVPPERWHTIPGNLPLFGIEIIISTIFYTSWIYVVDWFLEKLAVLTGTAESLEFKLSNQLITLVPAVLMAILFNSILRYTWGLMDNLWTQPQQPFLDHINWQRIRAFHRRSNEALTILALIAAYYLCVNNQVQEKLKKLLVDSEKQEKENLHARFIALKNQISPHFLFNNLSVLSSLVESRPEKSSEFIQQLSLAYRYILEQAELHQISLKEEVAFLETYTYLLRMRFKEKIIIDADLSPADLERYSIIPLTLQLLIENAVKHNTMSVSNPLRINIGIEGGMLVVSNPLQLRQLTEPTTGLGLKNIINRYKLLLDKDVIIDKNSSHFVVKIPLIP
ncbi:sensor histidine kinase [Dyadobacter sp. Leaf189]|uniref:sensor histidine kinase n=1 Tax=Dyadobacter sp. Leaf189 TaxID=1736295 RepID=UPI0006F7AEF2|nr:histidine kinase [Dyadobacter sp. Leaf189]KQS31014.1 histidine kinase [Dyadobacter sp. Leaf189]